MDKNERRYVNFIKFCSQRFTSSKSDREGKCINIIYLFSKITLFIVLLNIFHVLGNRSLVSLEIVQER